MGRHKAELEPRQRTLMRNNTGSFLISLPLSEIKKLGWQAGQKLAIRRQSRGFIIQSKN